MEQLSRRIRRDAEADAGYNVLPGVCRPVLDARVMFVVALLAILAAAGYAIAWLPWQVDCAIAVALACAYSCYLQRQGPLP